MSSSHRLGMEGRIRSITDVEVVIDIFLVSGTE